MMWPITEKANYELIFDLYKHITTLSSAGIVVVVAYWTKIDGSVSWPILLALTAFLSCIATGVVQMTSISHGHTKVSVAGTYAGAMFFTGVLALLFGIRLS